MSRPNEPKLPRDEYTEYIYDKTYFGETVNVQTFKNVISGINSDMEVENRPIFLEGLSARLTQLGIACTAHDTEIMLSEVKKRYKTILGKNCPRTVQEWCKGTTPDVTNRQNNYELCYALEMD